MTHRHEDVRYLPAPANVGNPWCAKQDEQLVSLASAGKSVAEVAQIMGRTQHGIVARADRLSYRLTSTDQYTLLSDFIRSADTASSSAATTPATHRVPEAIEGANVRTPGLQVCHTSELPLLLEVHSEQFYVLLHAIEAAGFEVKSRANLPSRYVVTDAANTGQSV